jgi:hypothetical protein
MSLVIFDTGVLAFECCFSNLMSAAVYGLGVGLFLPFVLATLGTFIALPLFAQGFASIIDVLGCAYRTKPGSHVRSLKAKRCTKIPWFSVPVCPRVSGDAKGLLLTSSRAPCRVLAPPQSTSSRASAGTRRPVLLCSITKAEGSQSASSPAIDTPRSPSKSLA